MKLFVRRFVFIRSWCHGQTSSSAFETKNKSTLRLIFVGHHKLQGAFRLLGNLGHLIRTGDQNAKSVEARWAFSCLARASSCPDYIFYFRCGDTTPDHSIKLLEVVWLKARIWSATTNSLERKTCWKNHLVAFTTEKPASHKETSTAQRNSPPQICYQTWKEGFQSNSVKVIFSHDHRIDRSKFPSSHQFKRDRDSANNFFWRHCWDRDGNLNYVW